MYLAVIQELQDVSRVTTLKLERWHMDTDTDIAVSSFCNMFQETARLQVVGVRSRLLFSLQLRFLVSTSTTKVSTPRYFHLSVHCSNMLSLPLPSMCT